MLVRPATRSDVDDWRALARSVETLFGAPMADDAQWNDTLARTIERGNAWVAVDGSQVLGGLFGRSGWIDWLAVLPGARRQGAGTALVERALAVHGAVEVTTFGATHPHPDAAAARHLYRSCGFVSAGPTDDGPDGTPRERFAHPGVVMLSVLLWPHPGAEAELIAYEDRVLALVPAHGGRVRERLRNADANGGPFEMHVIEFPSQTAFDAYMHDERRVALAPERDRAIARTQVIRTTDPELVGDGIVLRPLRVADAPTHKAGEDTEQIRAFGFPGPASLQQVEDAIRAFNASWANFRPVRNFGIWDAASSALLGNVEVRLLSPGRVNLSYVVWPQWRRRRVATRAAQLALSYARDQLGARVAVIETLPDNTASMGVARALGATRIGESTSDRDTTHVVFELAL